MVSSSVKCTLSSKISGIWRENIRDSGCREITTAFFNRLTGTNITIYIILLAKSLRFSKLQYNTWAKNGECWFNR